MEMTAGDLLIDFAKRTVTSSGEPVRLTRIEFDMLALLARNAGRVVTSRMLLEKVWGPEYVGDTQTLRVHVSHLRQKIEAPGDVPRYVLTEPGVGFRFRTSTSRLEQRRRSATRLRVRQDSRAGAAHLVGNLTRSARIRRTERLGIAGRLQTMPEHDALCVDDSCWAKTGDAALRVTRIERRRA